MQGDEDRIYTKHHPNIMVLSDDDEHPYSYGHVLDLFHIGVMNNGPNSILTDGTRVATLEMVWVHWYTLSKPQGPSGFHSLRYPSVSLCDSNDSDAFGLIHPDDIVRCVHIIRDFNYGNAAESSGPASDKGQEVDTAQFCVNMYGHIVSTSIITCAHHIYSLADRDMFMRFRGGGIGHMYMRSIEPWLDSTGWGKSWPSLSNRDPNPDCNDAKASTTGQHSSTNEGDGGESGDSSDKVDEDVDDDDGEDLEQLVDTEEDEEESSDEEDSARSGSEGSNTESDDRNKSGAGNEDGDMDEDNDEGGL